MSQKSTLAHKLYQQSFARDRSPRSPAYKEGVSYILEIHFGHKQHHDNPYNPYHAESDAWFAGCVEGNCIVRNFKDLMPSDDVLDSDSGHLSMIWEREKNDRKGVSHA